MNSFRRLVLTFMSCCVLLGGCGRTEQSDNSMPDGIVNVQPSETYDLNEDNYEEEEDEPVQTTTSFVYEYEETTTVTRARGYVADGNRRRPETTTQVRDDNSITPRTTASKPRKIVTRATAPKPKIVTSIVTVTKIVTAPATSEATVTADTDVSSQTGTGQTGTGKVTTTKSKTTTTVTTTFKGKSPKKIISEMTLKQKVCQMFIVTPEQLSGGSKVTEANTSIKKKLASYPVAGVLLSEDNLKSETQLSALMKNMQYYIGKNSDAELFFAVCEQGGDNSPVAEKLDIKKLSAQKDYGLENKPDELEKAGKEVGKELAKLGFHINFAPSASTDKNGYSSDAEIAAELVKAMVKGLDSGGIAPAVSAFPGSEDFDTRFKLKAFNYLPFRKAVENGAQFIQMSDKTFKAFDDELPAVFSSTAYKSLRVDLDFDGIAVTCRLDKSSITKKYDSGEAAVLAVKAGADILLAPKDLDEAVDAICKAVEDGEIKESKIDEIVEKIIIRKKIMELC